MTRCWREMDSNFQFLVARRSNQTAMRYGTLENGSGSVGGPKVRIHLPPAESHRREPDSNHRSLATRVGLVMENVENFADARRQAIPQYDATGMLGSALS